MEERIFILEHEILRSLLKRNSITLGKAHLFGSKEIPTFKRDYNNCSLHFGTLVDIHDDPKKYENEKSLGGKVLTKDDVNISKYGWGEVSEAIEILVHNKHIREDTNPDKYGTPTKREIFITDKGAIDFRTHFYLKEYDKIMSIERSYEIQKRDRWQKKYWYLVELAKYIVGGIVGAAIALMFTKH